MMRTRTPGTRAALAALLAATAATPALAAPVPTEVRIEGAGGTLVGQSAVVVDDQGTETFFEPQSPFGAITAPRDSVFWQLSRTTSAAGLDLGWRIFDFGVPQPFVSRIGPEAGAGALGWNFRVNARTPSAFAADQVRLAAGDRVLWFYGSGMERTLEVALSADVVALGAALAVTVTSRDPDGVPSPAAGAVVRYGGTEALADAQGRAAFVGQAAGVREVQATRAGEIRSPALRVCSYEQDPTTCNLPPLPAPAPAGAPPAPAPAPAPAAPGTQEQADRTPPGSRITSPRAGRTVRGVRALRGTAGPDRSDVGRVEVALAQRVGTQCRFRGPDGRFAPLGPCAQPVWTTARTAGGSWLVGLKGTLPAGRYRAWSRATDGAGNREAVGLAGVNATTFTVAPGGR
jgi:hypothetical protein